MVPHSKRHRVIKAKRNHEGREEHEGQESQNESLETVFEHDDIEVDQQPSLYTSQFHVREQLSFMYPLQLVNALQLQNQFAFDQHINSVATVQLNPFVLYGLRML